MIAGRIARAVVAAAVVGLAAPLAAYAADVDGCDVTLAHAGGAWVNVYGPDDLDGWTSFDAVDGTVVIDLAHGFQFAPGHYVAVWDDGERDAFDLDCPVEPDPTPDPDAPEPSIEPDPGETFVEDEPRATTAPPDAGPVIDPVPPLRGRPGRFAL